MTTQQRMQKDRSQGAGVGLIRVEVLVPPEGRSAILREAARLRDERRRAPTESLEGLYNEALERFGARCLWNASPSKNADGLRVVADRLRRYGGMDAWKLASKIREELNDAAR